ncbi:hypothetical protein N7492_003293 [Penicillium capsulatum]|uniref:Uncharacterized protein n=1 Tax=Penicillium capsulatum TaxID=69766 RepID=A0A9W9LW29_9EURO|nr:hypothetical protein N7492_003293 [Penicillium capsulatum]KAJ6122123.1 hypothetical protein N7512_004588 [Penicillium capsulatum]
MASTQKVRRLVLTAAVTSITIAGTLYGAGLKTNQEVAENNQKRREATFDEQMSSLQGMRSNLTARKGMIETQLRDLDARIQEKQKRAAEGNDNNRPAGGR